MAQEVRLYQIGGFRGHATGTSVELAQRLCPPKGGIELMIGTYPSGATYLLLDEHHFTRLFRRSRDPPRSSPDFRSISPVYFESREALQKTLDLYVSAKKNKKGLVRDRSKANIAYTVKDVRSLAEAGERRSEFELQRVFYRACRCQLPSHPVYDFPYAVTSRLQSIKLVSFAFTLWKMDRRPYKERIDNPKILDIGFTEFDLPDSSKELRVKTSLHWLVEENSRLNNPGSKRVEFRHGNTETLQQSEIAARLQNLFSDVCLNAMLLVHDNVMTGHVLTALGIDISKWQTDLYNVLRPSRSQGASSSARRRSRSPRRDVTRDPRQRPPAPEQPSGTAVKPIRVDVQQLFGSLKQVPSSDIGITPAARELRLKDDVQQGNDWCAGNESELIGLIWQAMVSGNALDEQRRARWSSTNQPGLQIKVSEDAEDAKPSTSQKTEPDVPADAELESDFDPNDIEIAGKNGGKIVGVAPAPLRSANEPVVKDPYEELEDDDW